MKLIFTLLSFLFFSSAFSQWTRVQQLPTTDIFMVYKKNGTLYAGGNNVIYISKDSGITWDSTNKISALTTVDNIIVYDNELYASCYSVGIYKSSDEGQSWQNVTAGLFPFVSDLCEWNGDLYASTLGNGVYKLDPVHRDNWSSFNTGLSSLSANLNSIIGTSNTLVSGTIANGLYDFLPSANSTIWNELFLLGQIHPTEGTYDIITAHDSLFLSGHTGSFYLSLNGGQDWTKFGNILPSLYTSLLNAKQALLFSRVSFDGVHSNTSFHYLKKDSLLGSLVFFSGVSDHFTYKLETMGNKLWDASSKGLFYMSLSDLPGITSADDTTVITPLPVQFVSFNVSCNNNNIIISWKTAQEQNSDRFEVLQSPDGNNWTAIGSLAAAGNINTETSYSFTKNNSGQNFFYRIAEYDRDGHVKFSSVARSSCDSSSTFFRSWPNPTTGKLFIEINTNNSSAATLRIFDSKGAIVKQQRTNLIPGKNQITIDISSFASGVYQTLIQWDNGSMKKNVSIMKF